MAKLPIRYYDDPVLRGHAKTIDAITPEIVQLSQDMIETMIAYNGVGIAGPQVGQLLRIFVIRDEKLMENGEYYLGEPEVIINPTLTKPSSEKVSMSEGCLSFPGLHLEILRPKSMEVRYQNVKGEWKEETLQDFRARVFMHENDHLNGVLTFDRIDKVLRKKVEPYLEEVKKKYRPNK